MTIQQQLRELADLLDTHVHYLEPDHPSHLPDIVEQLEKYTTRAKERIQWADKTIFYTVTFR